MQPEVWWIVASALLTLMTTYSLVGLVAVWGVQGRGHWFLRMAAVLAFLAAWLATADPRLCLLFMSQTAVVVARLWYVERRARRAAGAAAGDISAGRRFSLAELMLVVVLASGVLAMLVRLPPQVRWDWYADVLPGAILGLFTLIAARAAQSPRNAWLRAAMLVLAFPAILMGAWLWLHRSARRSVGKLLSALTLLLLAVLPAQVFYNEFITRSLAYPPLLADNGYLDLLSAAEMVADGPFNIETLSGSALRQYLDEHRAALRLVDECLKRPFQAMLYDRMNDTSLQIESQKLERLSQVISARGGLALEEGDVAGAVESYLADIELGAAVCRGGVFMHDGFGFRAELLGAEGLQKIVGRLDKDACRNLRERLTEIDAGREPAERSVLREHFYFARAHPWKYRKNALAYALVPDEPDTLDALCLAVGAEKRARLRLLITHLALREFWLETNRYPDTLEELVPRYLPAVPLDPFADRALTYKKQSGAYMLYSIGHDRLDDSGTPAGPLALPLPKGDLVVDIEFPSEDSK